MDRIPQLRVVMEHITTKDAADFVMSVGNGRLGATVTPQHMLLNRNAMLVGGIRPHYYCLPILKREEHRRAISLRGGIWIVQIGRQACLMTASLPQGSRAQGGDQRGQALLSGARIYLSNARRGPDRALSTQAP